MSHDTENSNRDYDVDTQPASSDYTVDTEAGTVLTKSPPMTKSENVALIVAGISSAVIIFGMVGVILYIP